MSVGPSILPGGSGPPGTMPSRGVGRPPRVLLSDSRRRALAAPLFSTAFFLFLTALLIAVSVAFLIQSDGSLGSQVMVAALLAGCVLTDVRLLLVAIFGTMPFAQSIFGGEGSLNISASDLMSAAAALMLLHCAARGALRGGDALPPLAVFLALSVVSSALAFDGQSTLVSVGRNFTVTIVPLLLFASVGPRTLAWKLRCFERAWIMYVVGASLLACFMVLTFLHGGADASMYTLGIHKNSLGPTLGLGFVACFAGALTIEARRVTLRTMMWAGLVLCAVGLLLSFSRGAWLSTAAACTLILYVSGRYAKAAPAAVIATVALLFVWQFIPSDVADYATDISTNAHTIQTRLDSIDDTMTLWWQAPFLGHGVGLRKLVAPHNIIIEMLGEVGVVGVSLFLAAVYGASVTLRHAWLRFADVPQARPIVLASMGGFAVTLLHGLADMYWRRGVAAGGWAGVGMAAALLTLPRSTSFQRPAPTPEDLASVDR